MNSTINLIDVNKKHMDYIVKSLNNKANVAEGAVRARQNY